MKFPVFQTDYNSGERFSSTAIGRDTGCFPKYPLYSQSACCNSPGLQISGHLEGGAGESLFRVTQVPLSSRQSQADLKNQNLSDTTASPRGVIWANEHPLLRSIRARAG